MMCVLAVTALGLCPLEVQSCPQPLPLPVDPKVITRLTGWIEANTVYDPAALGPPTIFACRTGEVIKYEGQDILVDHDLRAAYDRVNDRIFLVNPWSAQDPRNLSSLLHELIHRSQLHAREWPCAQASEIEAYYLQHLWLAEQGIVSGFNWFKIEMRARCPAQHHP